MMRAFMWVTSRLRSILGLDWIAEAREIAEESRERNNVIEEQFRPRRDKGAIRHGQ